MVASGLCIGCYRSAAYHVSQSPALRPGVPTLIEQNVREVEVFALQCLLGPAGIAAATVQRLNAELNRELANTTVLKRFLDFGMEPMPGTPEQFRAFARAEAKRWGPIIRNRGISLD
jgi:tripartite-type tricarboxylate transporter receptor subunit TctC